MNKEKLIDTLYWIYKASHHFRRVVLISVFGGVSECKHNPTCAEYARQALKQHGTMRGLWLAGWRLARCW